MIQPVDTPAVSGPSAEKRDPKLYGAALDFERQLVEQLAKQLQATTKAFTADGDDEQGGGAAGFYESMLPGTMADAVRSAGGFGLAPELYRSLARDAG
jgi:Rod binding domain-containing protein